MGKAKIGIGVGISIGAVVALVITITAIQPSNDVNSNLQSNIAPDRSIGSSSASTDDSLSDVSTLRISYSVQKVDILKTPTVVWSYSKDGYYMEVYLDARNESNESQDLPEKADIKLLDSKNRIFDVMWFNVNNTPQTLQPNLGGELNPVFLVSFDKDSSYTLLIEDKPVELGSAIDFNVDSEVAIELALEHKDITYCDLAVDTKIDTRLTSGVYPDASAYCIERYEEVYSNAVTQR